MRGQLTDSSRLWTMDYWGEKLMDQLAGIARQMAVDAINLAIAKGGDTKKITEAQDRLLEGDVHRSAKEFKDAVSKYKDALSKAEDAIK